MKTAFITGITGQDGSYMAELLLSKGYEVHGMIRKASTFNTHRIDHIYRDSHDSDVKLFLHYGDLSDSGALTDVISRIKPDEIYNFGAQSHVRASFDLPEYTGNVTGIAVVRMLDSIKRMDKPVRFFQASTSELYGGALPPQNEDTKFIPRSPYASAKLFGYWSVVNYREAYNLFATNCITFNHESPRRGETFVTRKITRTISRILAGLENTLYLGNLDSYRDWGYAAEYVSIIYDIMQLDKPVDVAIGTGESYTVSDFLNEVFNYCGVVVEWQGSGVDTTAKVVSFDSKWKNTLKEGQIIVKIDPRYFRPTEVDHLRADITYLKNLIGREPKVKFHDLVKIMMDADMISNGLPAPGVGIARHNELNFDWSTNINISNLS
jgi:GDPmannose 4,6-dehydratase